MKIKTRTAELAILPKKHILNIIRETKDHHPNFCLFLGAGASVSSGVKSAGKMVEEWRKMLHDQEAPGTKLNRYLAGQSWHDQPDEYSILFERLFGQASQRREYIETCLKNSSPSWGYIYLTNLIRERVFNTVFTTNFDDLINEACFLYTGDVRPLICAHDSSIRSVRITSHRPKVVKLHGDFLFDNIKNTARELESLETNIREKFKQYALEFGLVVVGYSGRDRSVMDTLEILLRSDGYFPNGIYWCIRSGEVPCNIVQNLTRFPNFQLIEIDGFDEFFADLHEAMGLELPEEMADPYKALTERLNSLIDNARLPEPNASHKLIERDMQKLRDKISPKATAVTAEGELVRSLQVPILFLAETSFRTKNYDDAEELLDQQLALKPNGSAFRLAFNILAFRWNDDKFTKLLDQLKQFVNSPDVVNNWINDSLIMLIRGKKYAAALQLAEVFRSSELLNKLDIVTREYLNINIGQIYIHQKNQIPSDLLSKIESIAANSEDEGAQIGAAILLQRFEDAKTLLLAASKEYRERFLKYPIAELLPAVDKNELLADRSRNIVNDGITNQIEPDDDLDPNSEIVRIQEPTQ